MLAVDSLKGALVAILAGIFLHALLKSIRNHYKLSSIPTVGPSGFFSSYIGAWRAIWYRRQMLEEGYQQFYHGAFKIPGINNWAVVINSPDMIKEYHSARDDYLSLSALFESTMHTDFTMGSDVILEDHLHVEAVRNSLTRNIKGLFDDIRDEVAAAFGDYIPVKDTWVKIPVLDMTRHIVCRTTNRIFVGLPLCRNPEYVELNIGFTIQLVVSGMLLDLTPSLFEPVIAKLFSKVPGSVRQGIKLLRPEIERRLARDAAEGPDWEGRPNDYLSWMIGLADLKEKDVGRLVRRILAVNFAAIHTTSGAFTSTFFNLTSYPEYVQPLREEVEEAIKAEGWSKAAISRMHKLDSFVKESVRLHSPTGSTSSARKVLKDFTFSNGITIPAGVRLGVASQAIHQDENVYPNPSTFDGYRFYKMRTANSEGKTSNQQTINLSMDFGVFGYGKHACPGRFFAVNEIKLLLAHILVNYDFKYEGDKYLGSPPPPLEMMNGVSPNPTAEVMFRTRKN